MILPAQAPAPPQDIRIELRRNATTVTVIWPTGAAAECAAWMRELLR
jgi:transposase